MRAGRTVVLLAASTLLAFPFAVRNGFAQDAASPSPASSARRFSIPAGDLSAALVAFGRQAGLQISFSPEIATGKTSPGVSGALAPRDALGRLLTGTGVTYRFANPTTVTLSASSRANAAAGANAQGAVPLAPIEVRGESAWGPVQGYVAHQSATGTKTDTPLIETPQSISVVTRDQMDAQQADSMKQALRYTAGVSAENRANFSSADIMYNRGFILNRYLDGMRLQGDAAFVSLQPELYGIERVEVLRGPASVLFGQGSPGGIVNLVSKRPTTDPFGEIVLQGGSYDHYVGAFDLGGPLDKDGKYLYRVTGLFRDADNQVDFVKDQRVFIAPAFTWRPNADTSLTILANYQRDPKAGYYNFVPYNGSVAPNIYGRVPTGFYAGDPSLNQIDRTQASVGYLFDHRFNEVLTVRQNLRYQDMSGNLNQVLPLFMPDDATLNRYAQATHDHIKSFSTDNQAEAKFAFGPVQHKVLFGLDYQHTLFGETLAQDFGPDINVFNPVYYLAIPLPSVDDPNVPFRSRTIQSQQQTGLYAQDQIKIDRLSILVGGRSDRVSGDTSEQISNTNSSQSDRAFTKRVGAVYQFDNGIAPYATYATSFDPVLGTDANGQPFKPTTGTLYEGGVKFQPAGFNGFLQFSVFDLTQQNVLTSDPNNPGFRMQTGAIHARGYEIEGKASVTDRLDVIANYAYVDPKVTQSLDVDLGMVPVNVPRQIASAWADYTIRDGIFNGLGFGAGVRYIGQTFADPANTIPVPAYTVTDAVVHYDLAAMRPELKGARISVNATNLFDNIYASQCTYVNLFGPYANCVYGLRRQVLATLRYRW